MAICSNCRSSMSDDADFCGHCGARLEPWEPPDDMVEATRAVAADLASGKSKEEVIADLVTYDEWPEEPATSFVEQVEEEVARGRVSRFVEDALRSGQTKEQIIATMVEQGFDRRNAASWVSSVEFQMERQDSGQHREFPIWDFLIGVPCMLIGAAVSYGTYSAAGPGETYVIWWGIIVYGGFRVIRGLIRLAGG